MRLGLRAKFLLLVLPLAAFSLLLLAFITSSFWTLQGRIAEFRTNMQHAMLAGKFTTAMTRQVMETLDVAFVAGEEIDEFEDAQRTARESLSSWIKLVSREVDPHAGQKLGDLLEIERLYMATQSVLQEIIDLGRQGDRELALEVVEQKLEPLADDRLFGKMDTQLRAERDELTNSLHEVIGAMGQMRVVGDDAANHVEEFKADYRQTVLASRLLVLLNRQMMEYASIVLVNEGTHELRFAQHRAEQTLGDWDAMFAGEVAEGELCALGVIEDKYVQLGSLGEEVLCHVEQGEFEVAWQLLEGDMAQLMDKTLLPLVAEHLMQKESELAESMNGLSESMVSAARIVFVVAAFVVLVGIASPLLLHRRIVKPILQLTEATKNIEFGDLERLGQITSDDEIGRLASTCSAMADRLQRSQEVLEQRVRDRTADVQQALKSAQAATQAKSDFLANMSHEIRTPLTAILGFAENLLDTSQAKSQREKCIHTIQRNGDNLLTVINDILDLSKIEAGRMTVERRDCQPCRIIAEVASLMFVRADAKGLPFNIEYIGSIPETIQCDSTRLRQILINIIGNAIKFTDEGGTVSLATRFLEGGEKPCLQFDVIDTGRGMTGEQVDKLFQPFMQADTSTTRKFGGTGLGLTISKRFAELLGGDISVAATEKGVGSTFRVTITTGPLDGVKMLDDPTSATAVANDAVVVAQAPRPDLQGCCILLAEDGPDNQRLIAFILKKVGADVTVMENGKLALDAALAAREEGKPFDVILMDMQMPVMDGYEATGQLRQQGYTGPIIALTAHAMDSDRAKCIKAGCDDYATKPIDRKKLIATIEAHLHTATA